MSVKWADVIGYEGLYEVSTDGRVRTVQHVTNGHVIRSKELTISVYKSQRYARVRPKTLQCTDSLQKHLYQTQNESHRSITLMEIKETIASAI